LEREVAALEHYGVSFGCWEEGRELRGRIGSLIKKPFWEGSRTEWGDKPAG